MNWKDLAGALAPMAPTLGRMLGGLAPFPGGAGLGQWAGEQLARQLGVPATPTAVAEAINTRPANEVREAIANAEDTAKEEWEAKADFLKASSADINETMRAEVTANIPWWHWRHLLGYVIGLWFLVPLAGLTRLIIYPNVEFMQLYIQLLTAASTYVLGGSALLGAVAWDTSRFKETINSGQARVTAASAVLAKVAKR